MQLYPEITFHVSCPYTPEQNGLVERKHRHIIELSLATMFNASIPLIYWDQIFESVAFIINKLPCISGNILFPFETLFHQAPDYKFFRLKHITSILFLKELTWLAQNPVLHPCSHASSCQNQKALLYLILTYIERLWEHYSMLRSRDQI
jgi:hypothetical protein